MGLDPELREFTFRLHRSGRPWDKRPDEVDWEASAVGEPAHFTAVHIGNSGWYAKSPVTVVAPEALPDAAWTVTAFWPEEEAVPTMTGKVGRPLSEGEEFALPVTDVLVGGVPRP